MQTTALLVELVVIGVFACAWVLPLVNYAVSPSIIPSQLVTGGLYLVVGTAILYFIGMLTNFLADLLFRPVDERICKQYGGKQAIQQSRARIMMKSKESTEYLLQRRSIVRVFRANSVNAALTSLITLANFAKVQTWMRISPWYVVAVLALLTAVFFDAYRRTLRGYFAFVRDAGAMANDE